MMILHPAAWNTKINKTIAWVHVSKPREIPERIMVDHESFVMGMADTNRPADAT